MTNLTLEEFRRYGRQMVLPEIGLHGQIKIKSSSVLVIGAGGLGCPSIAYLAAAGIGLLGIVDDDVVELSNCHRQILHKPNSEGFSKVESAKQFVKDLNHNVEVVIHNTKLTHRNSFDILEAYDLVLDCTDNQATRYLISDVCVILGKVLISGSALKSDGQIATYNLGNGPCYRCLFPSPTPIELIQSCGEAGIIGPVVGTIGVLQALEALKYLLSSKGNAEDQAQTSVVPKLTLFTAFGDPQWRTVKLRSKSKACRVCRQVPEITRNLITSGEIAYDVRNSDPSDFEMLQPNDQVTAQDYKERASTYMVIDVRNEVEFAIAKLDDSINYPLRHIHDLDVISLGSRDTKHLVVCRRGHDSQIATIALRQKFPNHEFNHLGGGLQAYSRVDEAFPYY